MATMVVLHTRKHYKTDRHLRDRRGLQLSGRGEVAQASINLLVNRTLYTAHAETHVVLCKCPRLVCEQVFHLKNSMRIKYKSGLLFMLVFSVLPIFSIMKPYGWCQNH